MGNESVNQHEEQIDERLFRVNEDIYRISVPTGFPVGDVNLYFLDGSKPTLIDTGVAGVETTTILSKALAALNRGISDISTILLTHIHVDHAANAREYRKTSGATVKVFHRGIRRLSDVQSSFKSDNAQYKEFFLRCGFDIDMVMRQQALTRKMLEGYPSCADVEPIQDGDLIPVAGGRTIRALYRPGHSASDMVFELPDKGIVFTGDHVLPHITPNPTIEPAEPGEDNRPMSLIQYRESLMATRDMQVAVACPGHGIPFEGLSARCEQILDLQTRRTEKILKMIRDYAPVTYKALAVKLFGRLHLWDVYLSISEIVGACDLLEERGRVVVDRSGPVDRISAV